MTPTAIVTRGTATAVARAIDNGILFSSFPKSGTYLFWRICRALQQSAGHYRSYSGTSGIGDLLLEFIPEEGRPYAYFEEVDQLYKDGDQWRLYVHHPMRNLRIDLDHMLESGSLLWLHEPPSVIESLAEGRRKLYMLRDGRAVVNSLIHHFTRPSVRATHPTYKIEDPLELYQRKDNFRKYVCIWRDHVRDFFQHQDDYFLMRFEDLVSSMPEQVARLAEHLEIDCDPAAIAEPFGFDAMKSASPTHVRSGTNDDWRRYYDEEHVAIFKEEAGDLLIELGYADDLDW